MKDIQFLKGVGQKRAEMFAKKGIRTVEDLLYFFPRAHEDRSQIKKISQIQHGETVCLSITVFSPVRDMRIRRNMMISSMIACDDTGSISVIWYNNKYVKDQFHTGEEYILYGKITTNRGKKEIQNPIFEKTDSQKFTGKIVPIYPLTGGLTQKIIQSAMANALIEAGTIEEYIDSSIREKYNIAEINFSMQNIHFPQSAQSYEIARRRFVFEELLILQLALLDRKKNTHQKSGVVFGKINEVRNFAESLPFPLTNAQKQTINEICSDFKSSKMMNRLIQGDVGSGKTAVAAAAMYITAINGYQSAMMAPTEILASQHFDTITKFFSAFNITTVLLTGNMKSKEKQEVLEKIRTGKADVIIGTHAIISDEVEFKSLGLVIADEQHRFGVAQRARLCAKGNDPHMLIMSATPIPRTLALILYADLDVSVINELPPGRKPVKTYAVGSHMRNRVYSFLKNSVNSGMQAYVVCPLVEETEKSDLKNAAELAQNLSQTFPQFRVGLVHGRMKTKDKDSIMNEFAAGEINILVSTTVIEVGVNVPNANIMIIENAERFGLSQLHQLRGRVGRGSNQAFCILISDGTNDITRKRMETMCISNDGFYISEQDLKLRGPGDFFGTRQHGLPEMRIANLFEDMDILKQAQDAAQFIMSNSLDNYPLLKKRCQKILDDDIAMN